MFNKLLIKIIKKFAYVKNLEINVEQLEDEQEYSYANFDEYVEEIAPYFDAEYNDRFCDGIKQAIMVIRAVCREKMPRIMEYVVTK